MSFTDPSALPQLTPVDALTAPPPATPAVASAATPPAVPIIGDPESQPRAGADSAAAALLDVSGVSDVVIAEYESSVPPNAAAAAALLSQVTSVPRTDEAAASAVYQLFSPQITLELTAGS